MSKIPVYIVGLIVLITSALSCNNSQRNEPVIAKIDNKILYLSDIKHIFQDNISGEDSIRLLSDYVTKWARKQLILKKAENNLSANEKNVTAELEDYRTSLLIFRYEQAYVMQRLDTVVKRSDLEKFYNENSESFQLSSPLIKALYIKTPNDAPILKRIREIYRSNSEKNIEELETLCFQGAANYDYFNGEWVDFSVLLKELPPPENRQYENELISKRYIDTKDEQYTYLISARELKEKGSVPPFEHVQENIKSIILNKRKQDLVKKLENDIYNEALNHNELILNIDK